MNAAVRWTFLPLLAIALLNPTAWSQETETKAAHDAVRPVPRDGGWMNRHQSMNERVHYLDIGTEFLEDDGTLSKEIMPDLLHLSEKGYQIWAESIEPKVQELMVQ